MPAAGRPRAAAQRRAVLHATLRGGVMRGGRGPPCSFGLYQALRHARNRTAKGRGVAASCATRDAPRWSDEPSATPCPQRGGQSLAARDGRRRLSSREPLYSWELVVPAITGRQEEMAEMNPRNEWSLALPRMTDRQGDWQVNPSGLGSRAVC